MLLTTSRGRRDDAIARMLMSSTDTLNTVIPRLTAIVSGHKDFLNKMKQQDNNRKSLQNSAENALRPAATEKNERERERAPLSRVPK